MRATVIASCALATACSGAGPGSGDGAPEPDLECDEYESLTLGRCVRESDGLDCTGDPEEVMQFVELEDGDPMRMVVGPQAATMVVFLVETDMDIDPGDADDPTSQDNPLLEAEMAHGDEQLSEVVLRSSFSEDPDAAVLRSNSGLFLVIEEEDYTVIGNTYQTTARLTDKDGQLRCGRVDVTIEQNPNPPDD